MWPWGHLAFGYLLFWIYGRVPRRHAPSDRAALAVAFGTQFPDLVDKPLAWYLMVIPNGRSLTHSVITASIIIGAVYVVARRFDERPVADAFAIGYGSHLLGDSFGSILAGTPDRLAFLLWPALPPVVYDDGKLIEHVSNIEFTPLFLLQFVAFVATVLLWYGDGAPGTFGRLASANRE